MNEIKYHKFLSEFLGKTILTNDVIEKIISDYIIHTTQFHFDLIVFKTFGSTARSPAELLEECQSYFGIDDDFIKIHNQIHEDKLIMMMVVIL